MQGQCQVGTNGCRLSRLNPSWHLFQLRMSRSGCGCPLFPRFLAFRCHFQRAAHPEPKYRQSCGNRYPEVCNQKSKKRSFGKGCNFAEPSTRRASLVTSAHRYAGRIFLKGGETKPDNWKNSRDHHDRRYLRDGTRLIANSDKESQRLAKTGDVDKVKKLNQGSLSSSRGSGL